MWFDAKNTLIEDREVFTLVKLSMRFQRQMNFLLIFQTKCTITIWRPKKLLMLLLIKRINLKIEKQA